MMMIMMMMMFQSEEIIRRMLRVTQEKKLIGARGVVVAVGDILEQLEPPDENGLVSVRTSSGETGLIKNKYLGWYQTTPEV